MKTEQGLLYVAKGEKYIQEAAKSARSAKEAMNDISITIIADKETDHTVFDNLIVRKELVGDPSEASLYFDESPYDKTIYLDTDTYILDDIKEIYDILDNFDIAAAHSPGRYTKANPEYYFEEIPEPLPDFNRGVVGYKKSTEVDDFLEKWNSMYENTPDYIGDQQPFTKALLQTNIRIATLPPEYNCRFRSGGYVKMQVKILHDRCDDPEEVGDKLNRKNAKRVFYMNSKGNLVVIPKGDAPFFSSKIYRVKDSLIRSIRERGIYCTIIRSISKIRKNR